MKTPMPFTWNLRLLTFYLCLSVSFCIHLLSLKKPIWRFLRCRHNAIYLCILWHPPPVLEGFFSYLTTKPLSHLRNFAGIQQFYLIRSSFKHFSNCPPLRSPLCSWRSVWIAQQKMSQQIWVCSLENRADSSAGLRRLHFSKETVSSTWELPVLFGGTGQACSAHPY